MDISSERMFLKTSRAHCGQRKFAYVTNICGDVTQENVIETLYTRLMGGIFRLLITILRIFMFVSYLICEYQILDAKEP